MLDIRSVLVTIPHCSAPIFKNYIYRIYMYIQNYIYIYIKSNNDFEQNCCSFTLLGRCQRWQSLSKHTLVTRVDLWLIIFLFRTLSLHSSFCIVTVMLFSGRFSVDAEDNRGLKNLICLPVLFFCLFLRCGKAKIVLSVFSTPDLLCMLQKGSLTRWWGVKESVWEHS